MIATDGVFSMDGDIAPLHALAAWRSTMTPGCCRTMRMGLGVVGGGRGSNFVQGIKADVPLQMGTLSKALGAYGGYICASAAVVDLIRNRARTLIYSTGLPPAAVAAAIAALDLIEQRTRSMPPCRLQRPRSFARSAQLPEPESPIVPVVLGEAEAALEASQLLEENGFLVAPFGRRRCRQGTSRLRLTFTAQHPDEESSGLPNWCAPRARARRCSQSPRNESCFHHRDRHRYRQDLLATGLIRHMRSAGTSGARDQAHRQRV